MKKLNQIIGGSAIAIALLAMPGGMGNKEMEKAYRGEMLRAQTMKASNMATAAMAKTMTRMGNSIMG